MQEKCPKCEGTGFYMYDENHGTVCDACCLCDQGWWFLEEHYGENNNKWCCLAGCGATHVKLPDTESGLRLDISRSGHHKLLWD